MKPLKLKRCRLTLDHLGMVAGCEYFHGDLDRESVKSTMHLDYKIGSFLLRFSSRAGSLALSVVDLAVSLHF